MTTDELSKEKVKYEKSSRRVYLDSKGEKVPGVTTILSVLGKPALIDWAWKLGKEGIDYKKVRDDAASVGTICHFMCECYLRGVEPDLSSFPKDQLALAENGYIKFLQFWDKSELKKVEVEKCLVHQHLKYGGTIDCVAQDKNGNYVMIDLKTSKAIYDEYWSQVAAYVELWNNNAPDHEHFIDRNIIVRIGKDEAMDLEVQEKVNIHHHMQVFMGAYMVYHGQKNIKKENNNE